MVKRRRLHAFVYLDCSYINYKWYEIFAVQLRELNRTEQNFIKQFKKIRGMTDFSDQFKKNIMRYKRSGYNLNIMRRSACLVINPITLMAMLHSLIARRWIGRQSP